MWNFFRFVIQLEVPDTIPVYIANKIFYRSKICVQFLRTPYKNVVEHAMFLSFREKKIQYTEKAEVVYRTIA